MKIPCKLHIRRSLVFPWYSLVLSLGLIALTPFIHPWLAMASFAIELYRIMRFDEHVFMVDTALLLPFSFIFLIPEVGTALGTLIVVADFWYLIRRRCLRLDGVLIWLVLLILYLLTRMQHRITDFGFVASGLVFLYLMLLCADCEDALRIAKAYLIGLVLSSAYGMLFRGTPQLVYYLSQGHMASMEYSKILRFSGLVRDPNYYSVYLVLGLALLLQLYVPGKISISVYAGGLLLLCYFGLQTYSRTFMVMFVLTMAVTLVLLLRHRKYGVAFLMCAAAAVTAIIALSGSVLSFNVILSRFIGIRGISNLTTGRTDLLLQYLKHCFSSPGTCLFGDGLGAKLIGKLNTPNLYLGPHNLYVEILYRTGLIGLFLFCGFGWNLLKKICAGNQSMQSGTHRILALLPTVLLTVTYLSLQGMVFTILYVQYFIALSAVFLQNRQEEEKGRTMGEQEVEHIGEVKM